MTINTEYLESLFTDFSQFIATKDKQLFTTFKTSEFVNNTENYKYSVYNEARENLGQKWWKFDDIGTGKIQQAVSSAIKTRVNHNFQMVDNNLVDWRKKDEFSKRQKSRILENTLFNFYKNKINDSEAFQLLLHEGLSYQFIAYLFFIKDSQRFNPISQARFDHIFEIVGITDFKTSANASWENYFIYNDIIKQVRNFLRSKDGNATLLDAHSFLWIIGSSLFPLSIVQTSTSRAITQEAQLISVEVVEQELTIAEEDDEVSFPEGKEFYRLHKSKERNRELIKAAKGHHLKNDSKLCCQVCGFSFVDTYGEIGHGFIEAHHIFPISQLTEETATKIEDLALVCSNCHRMLHRRRPWLTIDNLKAIRQPYD